MSHDALLDAVKKYGQEHVHDYWSRLTPAEQDQLAAQLGTIDLALLQTLTEELVKGKADPIAAGQAKMEPAPVIALPSSPYEKNEQDVARLAGEAALKAGRIGFFLVAGGQGTRLGISGPKGIFEVGPVTKRSLFQIHSEKILALRRKYKAAMPWVIMTSDANDAATRAYFKEKNFFGLGEDTIKFCSQENMPAVHKHGKILFGTKSSLALSPNGHGGAIKALHDSGACAWLRKQVVDTLSYFQVDNALVRIGDPVFIGYHLQKKCEMSSKVVRKRDWKEKVGVVGFVNNKLGVIEYSDMPEAMAKEEMRDGSLLWWAGSIAIHLLDLGFIERLNQGGFKLPFHRAEKAVPCVNADGTPVPCKPGEKNGIKFETFIFDALPMAKASITLETERSMDFAPVKNAEGEDSPATCRAMMTALYAKWLDAAGKKVPRNAGGTPALNIEISPLTSLDGEGLKEFNIPEIKPGVDLVL